MKLGFYLSPCGHHIVEVVTYRENVHTGEFLVINFKDSNIEASGGNICHDYTILMSCWEFLGL